MCVCVSVCVCVCEKVTVEIQIHEHSVIVSLWDYFPALFVCCGNIVGLIYVGFKSNFAYQYTHKTRAYTPINYSHIHVYQWREVTFLTGYAEC